MPVCFIVPVCFSGLLIRRMEMDSSSVPKPLDPSLVRYKEVAILSFYMAMTPASLVWIHASLKYTGLYNCACESAACAGVYVHVNSLQVVLVLVSTCPHRWTEIFPLEYLFPVGIPRSIVERWTCNIPREPGPGHIGILLWVLALHINRGLNLAQNKHLKPHCKVEFILASLRCSPPPRFIITVKFIFSWIQQTRFGSRIWS